MVDLDAVNGICKLRGIKTKTWTKITERDILRKKLLDKLEGQQDLKRLESGEINFSLPNATRVYDIVGGYDYNR